ncbi:MAG: anhydro-N-acetylmuramic acid kinase [Acetobacter sp.]|nr:anhydro-N-acetylmuramic acid kinase [Acetobacter sp.]
MTKYRIIGNMTGNSMDAVDLVLTEFDGDKMTDICSYTKPYTKDMQEKIEVLRELVFDKTRAEIEALPEFVTIHNEYIRQIADCVDEMCEQNGIDKKTIDAIGFHGKTLDHNPPSKAKIDGSQPYTLQIGSGQRLADLTEILVVYDFRSDPLMSGFDGAPLVPPHNAHISASEGNGCYYNGGNTSNFALIVDGVAQIGADAGPFNEYTDSYIRQHTNDAFDKDGKYGKKGLLNKELLQELFNFGRQYYEMPLPKSGDPAYYYKGKIFQYVEKQRLAFEDVVHTFEYFAAYIAVQALTLVPDNISMPADMVLFGGGWKNPVVKESFEKLLNGEGYVLSEHRAQFANLCKRFAKKPLVRNSTLGDYMEARLFADLARYKLENRAWEIPEIVQAGKTIVCGRVAIPKQGKGKYYDCVNRAAKGWQCEKTNYLKKQQVRY